MGKKSEKHFAEYRLTNLKTGEVFQGRMWTNIQKMAGISHNITQIKQIKKWKLEQISDPEVWDEAAYRQKLYQKNKDKYPGYEVAKRLRDPLFERRKRCRLRKLKNMDGTLFTAEQHEEMLHKPCMICDSYDPGRMCADHCHTTNVVRGTLCRSCNIMLGNAKNSVERLENAAKYLRMFNDKES